MSTAYHSQYWAHALTLRGSGGDIEPLSRSIANARLDVYEASVVETGGVTYFLGRRGAEKFVGSVGVSDIVGENVASLNGKPVIVGPTDHANALVIRKSLPWTGPKCLGLLKSVGMGDRLGLATPGHIRAVRGSGLGVFLAQQSIREMVRTQRSPDDLAGQYVHVKTAGTSYLEALRAIAAMQAGLFREILDFARERYETDKATYHVSADVSKVPPADTLQDGQLPGLLDDFDTRQVLHVTFGSVLTADGGERFGMRILAALKADEEAHYAVLEKHLGRHVTPLIQ